MNAVIALAALALASCAESSVIETINIQVNHDHPYSHYTRPVREAHVLKPGEPGNCTDIARTKQAALKQAGVKPTLMACRLKMEAKIKTRAARTIVVNKPSKFIISYLRCPVLGPDGRTFFRLAGTHHDGVLRLFKKYRPSCSKCVIVDGTIAAVLEAACGAGWLRETRYLLGRCSSFGQTVLSVVSVVGEAIG